MEKPKQWMMLVGLVVCFAVGLCHAAESPQYVVVHHESDFEIRLYRNSTWMSALVNQLSFEKATLTGFHRLFQYTQGANLNWSRIAMTHPVVTSIVPEAGPFHSSAYSVRLYLPAKFQDDPPVPIPELTLKPYVWDSHCVAVRKFSGILKDENIAKEANKLAVSLSRANLTCAEESGYAYSVAQYDSPFRIIGRTNEIWADIDASVADDCKSSGIATY